MKALPLNFRPLSKSELAAGLQEAMQEQASAARPVCPPDGAEPGEQAAARLLRREPDGLWRYVTAEGVTAFFVARMNKPDGKKDFRPISYFEGDGWRTMGWPAPRPLYRLDEITAKADAQVVICEGEKAADAAARIFSDSIATTASGGANGAAQSDWALLAKRRVLIWPDHDAAGREYAKQVAGILAALDCTVSIIDAAALASLNPTGGARDPVEKWDAADAAAEWSDLQARARGPIAQAAQNARATVGGWAPKAALLLTGS